MKTLIVFFVIWIFVVPGLAGLPLVLTFVATLVPDLYFAFTFLALAFSVATIVGGPLCRDLLSTC